jgi:CheY-specific phosphatase CheX
MDCLQQSSVEIANQTLRFDRDAVDRATPKGEGKGPAAYIALLGEQTSVHLGIATSPDGCRAIARGLLGVRRTTELSDSEVMDGVNEVLNIVAGKVKSKMTAHDPTLRLGLPMFVLGEIRVTDGMEKASAMTRLGPVECELMVFRRKRAA